MTELAIARDKLAWIVLKARAFDEMVAPEGMEDGSNAADDREMGALEEGPDNPAALELRVFLADLNTDELADLLALVWTGRGDYGRATWREARASAAETEDAHAVDYLMGTPQLGDLISDGLEEIGIAILPEEENF